MPIFDGHCSGAIVKHKYPDCEMIGVNYGKDLFVEDSIKEGETVYMVDYTLQPFERMIELNKKCHLIWIDHHESEIEEYKKHTVFIDGYRKIGIGACYLVWKYLNNTLVPESVVLLSEYDVWDHNNYKTLPFQWGMRLHDTLPTRVNFWKRVFYNIMFVDETISNGILILNYQKSQDEKFCKAYSFETEFEGLKAICCNKGFTNSMLFDSVPKDFDIMITFCRLALPHKKWTVSIYTHRDDLDLGQIAKKHGGGGHKKAAGFKCETLPFDH